MLLRLLSHLLVVPSQRSHSVSPSFNNTVLQESVASATGSASTSQETTFNSSVFLSKEKSTLPETNIVPENGWSWKTFLLGWPIFSCYVNFRERIQLRQLVIFPPNISYRKPHAIQTPPTSASRTRRSHSCAHSRHGR